MPEGDDLSRLTDAELIGWSAALQPNALAALYDRHAIAAISLARRMVGSERAEQAVEDVFESVWRNAVHFDPGRSTPRAWLLGAVRQRCIDELRLLAASERDQIARQQEEEGSPTLGTADSAPHRSQPDPLRAAVATLPDDQRRVLELVYFDGWTRPEVAQKLQVPLTTVNSRIRIAFDELRTIVDAEAHDSR